MDSDGSVATSLGQQLDVGGFGEVALHGREGRSDEAAVHDGQSAGAQQCESHQP